jgi:hypothetical protein
VVVSDYLITPIEPSMRPLVARKTGVRDERERKDQHSSGHADSDRKRGRDAEDSKRPRKDCFVSESKIDCKI